MPKEASGAPAPIHIFRPGRHTAMQGRTISFSGEDLAATAGAYDPALHEAPLVIGHPQADAPAFGWVQGLTAGPEGLFAAPRQLEPAFAEAVEQGRYKKVSASFYAPDSPHNPVPGVYYLRHVGFLGAQPPAVKGLQPVQFADDGEGCVTVEFAEGPGLLRRLADVFRALREYIVEKDGAETADRVLPALTVSDLASAVVTQEATDEDSSWLPHKTVNDAAVAIRKQAQPANGYRQEEAAQAAANAADIPALLQPLRRRKLRMETATSYCERHPTMPLSLSVSRPSLLTATASEDQPKEEPMPQNPATQPTAAPAPAPEKSLDPAFAEAREQASRLAVQVAELKADARLTRARAVVERQVAAGRLTPGQSQGLAEFMAGLDDELNFEFAEASGQTASVTPLAWMTAFLEGLPRQVEFAEVSRDTHDRVDGLTPADAARAALEYQEEARSKGRIVSVTDALAAVRAGKKQESN